MFVKIMERDQFDIVIEARCMYTTKAFFLGLTEKLRLFEMEIIPIELRCILPH